MLTPELKKKIFAYQKSEITEHIIYRKLAQSTGDARNKKILSGISADELRHCLFWKKITGREIWPSMPKVWFYYFLSRTLGLTFGLKLMERGEGQAEAAYSVLAESIPGVIDIARDEDRHEQELLTLIEEERLYYVGSMILGLNDALVELSGSLAGFTLALQDSKMVAMVGMITGIAASLSMGSTSYLASKTEGGGRSPLKSALYTGIAYILTVIILVLPYLLLSNVLAALGIMIANGVIIILAFNFYISVAQDLPFAKRFFEMAALSLGIAAVSFGIGFLMRRFFGIEI